jgi:hypothetical protein
MRATASTVAAIALVSLLCAGCTSSATQATDQPTGSAPSAASMAEALDCDLDFLPASADEFGWSGATEQEALQAYRDDLSLDSASVVEWTGPRSSRSAERLWLVYTPDGAGRGVVFASELEDGRWVVAHEQLCADFQP